MRNVQTFWRYHNKPRPSPRLRHVVAHVPPEPGTVAHVVRVMKEAAEVADAAGTTRPWFPFEASEVAAIYRHKRDAGEGLWFALHDGRVFTGSGEPDTNDLAAYSAAGRETT